MEENKDISEESLNNLERKMASGQPDKLHFSGKPSASRQQAEKALGYTKDSKGTLKSTLDNLLDN